MELTDLNSDTDNCTKTTLINCTTHNSSKEALHSWLFFCESVSMSLIQNDSVGFAPGYWPAWLKAK